MPGFPGEAIRGPIRPSSDWEGKPKAQSPSNSPSPVQYDHEPQLPMTTTPAAPMGFQAYACHATVWSPSPLAMRSEGGWEQGGAGGMNGWGVNGGRAATQG